MLGVAQALVISDLHLAAKSGLFQADEQLAEFVRHVRTDFRRCHLFLNGDIFDFLVDADNRNGFDLDEAATRLTSIIDGHKAVFDELSLVAKSEEHELVFLSGNHDPELALPGVREAIEARLQPGRPSAMKWLTNGEAVLCGIGQTRVLIEHGDQYDEWNWIDHELIRRVLCLASHNLPYKGEYTPPPGSRLVLNRFNRIRGTFPWLETLQPFGPAIIPLVLEVILPAISEDDRSELLKAVKEFTSYGLRSIVSRALLAIDPSTEVWADGDEDMQRLNEWLGQYQRQEDTWAADGDRAGWMKRVTQRLRSVAVRWKLKNVSRQATFFDIDATDAGRDAVGRLIANDVDLVVHGHTHAARAGKVGKGLYINTGTWGRLTSLPTHDADDSTWSGFINELSAGHFPSLSRLTFARIDNCGPKTEATLFEWHDGAAHPLSAWCFADGQWSKSGE